MNILVLGGTKQLATDKDRVYYQRYVDFFKSSAGSDGSYQVTYALLEDLIIRVGEGVFSIHDVQNDTELKAYDVIFLRSDGLRNYMDVVASVNTYALANGIKMINDYSNIRDSSKLLQAVHFERLDIPVAQSLYVNPAVLAHTDTLDWQFPCIMKATVSSHGDFNYLVKSWDEVLEKLEAVPQKKFVLQRFVPNEGDYRILMIGNEKIVIGRSAVEGTHLNNTSKGGMATTIDETTIPEIVYEQCRRIMDDLKMTIAGVDVLYSKDDGVYYFLEVNAQPQLMSGAFVEIKQEMMGRLMAGLANQR